MLMNPRLEITSDAGIEHLVVLVGQDVDAVNSFHALTTRHEIASLRSQ
jgi:hypothetical protein